MSEQMEAILATTRQLMQSLYPRPNSESVTVYYTNDTIMHLISQLTFFACDIMQGEIQAREKHVMQHLTGVIAIFWNADTKNQKLYFAAAHLEAVIRDTFVMW